MIRRVKQAALGERQIPLSTLARTQPDTFIFTSVPKVLLPSVCVPSSKPIDELNGHSPAITLSLLQGCWFPSIVFPLVSFFLQPSYTISEDELKMSIIHAALIQRLQEGLHLCSANL